MNDFEYHNFPNIKDCKHHCNEDLNGHIKKKPCLQLEIMHTYCVNNIVCVSCFNYSCECSCRYCNGCGGMHCLECQDCKNTITPVPHRQMVLREEGI